MTSPCRDYQVLLSAQASGELPAPESERLQAHLESCTLCRSESEQVAELLGLVRLPPPNAADRRALDGLQSRLVTSWNRAQRRRSHWRPLGLGLSVAAAAAAALFFLPGTPPQGPQVAEEAMAAAEWQVPNVADLWATSAVIDEAPADGTTLGDGLVYASMQDLNDGL